MNRDSISLQLPFRFSKPRECGITIIADHGIPIQAVESSLNHYSDFVDMAKLSAGAAFLDPKIREKVALYKNSGIVPYFSGTLFEKFYQQDNLGGYRSFLENMEVHTVEIADGALNIPLENRLETISTFSKDFQVIGKIGSKDLNSIMSPSEWVQQMADYLEAGCTFVSAEGRGGTSGLYRPNGEIRQGLVADIVKGVDEQQVIFEAPNRYSQVYLVKLLGPNANFGEITVDDLLTLEALRNGLLDETLFVE